MVMSPSEYKCTPRFCSLTAVERSASNYYIVRAECEGYPDSIVVQHARTYVQKRCNALRCYLLLPNVPGRFAITACFVPSVILPVLLLFDGANRYAIYFVTYECLKRLLLREGDSGGSSPALLTLKTAVSGGFAGLAAWLPIYPSERYEGVWVASVR